MLDTPYNGWTNYATWRVNLEIFDGQSLDDLGMERLNLHDLGYAFMHYATEIIEMDGGKGLALDYARAFIANVDWREIAAHYLVDQKYRWGGTDEDKGVLEQAASNDTGAELK